MIEIFCLDCKEPYTNLGLDIVIPDEQFRQIHPEEIGILCANCICKRAEKLGGTVILAEIKNLPVHTDHCLKRQMWGDGECECKIQEPDDYN